ncbi:MAG: NAD(P)H-dependent glycerol-3-phosphate dehydrogenase [Eubacteriales bacterium]|nr:NAD(P)H-dependent glycerol-3-phosphate dehydrogenase [Eubacteriales bacterium]MDD4474805.1 NAD(P)H-dependent glycerol-3-phosphate dehydrogenase [Eubacteriales bacterium]
MRIAVVGCGRWGSFIAWFCSMLGHDVTIYGRKSSKKLAQLKEIRRNEYVALKDSIKITDTLGDVVSRETIIISVDSQSLRSVAAELKVAGIKNTTVVLCMKGLEIGSGKRLSVVVGEELEGTGCSIAVWLGPGHVQDFSAGIPNCMVIDSSDNALSKQIISALSGGLIRFYVGDDLIGNELGAAAKNVIGIAAGMLDGLGLPSLKGALMARGAREISRLIKACGGNELSAYGLCHLGDYEATVFSEHSHNRRFGEYVVRKSKGEIVEQNYLAEGYYTAKAIMDVSRETSSELPICEAVYKVLYENEDTEEMLKKLFLRSLKTEF